LTKAQDKINMGSLAYIASGF